MFFRGKLNIILVFIFSSCLNIKFFPAMNLKILDYVCIEIDRIEVAVDHRCDRDDPRNFGQSATRILNYFKQAS